MRSPLSHLHTSRDFSYLLLLSCVLPSTSLQRVYQSINVLFLLLLHTYIFLYLQHHQLTCPYFRNLAIGIGIQNFPEGLAVSLPLQAAGFSTWRSFWYGQLSGMVEPIFGVLGAVAVGLAEPALPYALAFAAGAMIYVVVDDIIPEANTNDNGKLASWGAVLGFLVMMTLDVGLG